ncbi:hypothetical protein BU16DRAFT_82216 [Lophium mytilinum]|uniref:Uncharacterized protein n=1 Tax=Lophium mytilinum TaxID=390894 RepID=A0A6A6QN19_9PEZI|nr:hypothetical protein BU16DRAFT_82216 [Lophium mytilinum]
MDWQSQAGYFPYNPLTYPYPGYDVGGDDTGYVEFDGDDDDGGMYEPEEANEPVPSILPAGVAIPTPGLDGASDVKAQPTEPESNAPKIAAQQQLSVLREKLLASRKSGTPSAEPKQAPSAMSADVDNFIAEERAAAEAANAKNTPTKAAIPSRIDSSANKAPWSIPKQATPPTTTAQGRATAVSASSTKKPTVPSTIKNNGPAQSPKPLQQVQQPKLTKQKSPPQPSVGWGEMIQPKAGSNAQQLLPGKEVAKPTVLRGGTNTETSKSIQPAQPERKDSNTDKARDRQEPATNLPRQNNSRSQPNKNETQTAQIQTQATKANGSTPSNNTTNRETTASTKQVRKDSYPERTTQGERQPENSVRRPSIPLTRNLEPPAEGQNAAQRQPAEKTTQNAIVLSNSRVDSGHDQRLATEGGSINAAAHSHYFDDLDEWLEMTRYHDREYRQKLLNRHRAFAELEREAERINKEYPVDEDEHAYLPRLSAFRAPSRASAVRRIASTSSMRPPLPPAENTAAKTFEVASKYDNIEAPQKRGLSPSAPQALRPDKQPRLDAVAGAQQRLDEHTDVGMRGGHEKGPVSPHR